jgi:ATPase subunit of ABC transporter with duplicated ATPase domains
MPFVSHDRSFLRALSNRVLSPAGIGGEAHVYPGTHVEHAAQRARGAGVH